MWTPLTNDFIQTVCSLGKNIERCTEAKKEYDRKDEEAKSGWFLKRNRDWKIPLGTDRNGGPRIRIIEIHNKKTATYTV